MGTDDFPCLLVGHEQMQYCYVQIRLTEEDRAKKLSDLIHWLYGPDLWLNNGHIDYTKYNLREFVQAGEGEDKPCFSEDLEPGFCVAAVNVYPSGCGSFVNHLNFFRREAPDHVYGEIVHNDVEDRSFTMGGHELNLDFTNPSNLEETYKFWNEDNKESFDLFRYTFNRHEKLCDCGYKRAEDCPHHADFWLVTFHPQVFWHIICQKGETPPAILWKICDNSDYVPPTLENLWKGMSYVEAEKAIRDHYAYIRTYFQKNGLLDKIEKKLATEDLCTKGHDEMVPNVPHKRLRK